MPETDTDTVVDFEFDKDEDLKATESRIAELRKKKDRTPEEEQEFTDLKKHHRGRLTEQLQAKEEARIKEAERAARAEQALEDANRRLKEIEASRERSVASGGNGQYAKVKINGKEYYTDEALNQMVVDGRMSQAEAWKLQRELIKAETRSEMQQSLSEEDQRKAWMAKRQESLDYVATQGYGHFLDTTHPKHNPNDPLYKEANRLWTNGYKHNEDGPRLALEDAKKNLGMTGKRTDLSHEFSVVETEAAAGRPQEGGATGNKQVALNAVEEENAYRYYVVGNVSNPKTGKTYTRAEALVKALAAKKNRLGQK